MCRPLAHGHAVVEHLPRPAGARHAVSVQRSSTASGQPSCSLACSPPRRFIGSSESLAAIFVQALAGGAVLALIAHAMIPESIHDGGSLVVLPTVAGFLCALYLALAESFG